MILKHPPVCSAFSPINPAIDMAIFPATQVMGANCEGSRSEVGCLRFDMMRAVANADTFVSYEAQKWWKEMDWSYLFVK